MAPPPPPPQTSTPIDQHKKQLSSESLSSLNTDSGAKSMEKSDSLYCTPELDIETEKIVKDEENRNRQSQDNYLQSKPNFFYYRCIYVVNTIELCVHGGNYFSSMMVFKLLR